MSNEDDELEVIVERAGGLDDDKDMVAARVRVPGPDGTVTKAFAEFQAFTEDLLALRDSLVSFPRRDLLVDMGLGAVGGHAAGQPIVVPSTATRHPSAR